MKKTMKKSIFAALAFFMMVGVAIILPLSAAHAFSTFLGRDGDEAVQAGQELQWLFQSD